MRERRGEGKKNDERGRERGETSWRARLELTLASMAPVAVEGTRVRERER